MKFIITEFNYAIKVDNIEDIRISRVAEPYDWSDVVARLADSNLIPIKHFHSGSGEENYSAASQYLVELVDLINKEKS